MGARLFIDTKLVTMVRPQLTVLNVVMYIEMICYNHPLPTNVFYKKIEKKFGAVEDDTIMKAMMVLESRYDTGHSGLAFVIGADSIGFIPRDDEHMKWELE